VAGEWIYINDDIIQYRTLDGDDGKTNGGHWCGQQKAATTRRLLRGARCCRREARV
jgi:hypothetical protein